MKKWINNLLISALLTTALFAFPVSAKNIATAVLDKAADGNNVTVALDFSETKTEIITTLRFKLLVAVEEGELAEDAVSFTFADIPGEVKDAKITYDADVTDYIVDIVVSGKENIFHDAAGVPLVIGTLSLPDGDYSAEVGLVAYDDGSEEEATDDPSDMSTDVIEADEETSLIDTVSVLEYVENAGLDVMKVQMKADKQINVGKEIEQPQTEPSQSETSQSETSQTETSQTEPSQTEPSQTESSQAGPSQTDPSQSATETPQSSAEPIVTRFSKNARPVLTVTAVTGTKKLKFSWEKLSGADGYQIAQYNSKRKKYEKIATVGKKKSTYTAKFAFGKTCRFKVRAYKKGKKGKYKYSLYSDVVTVKTSAFDKTKKTKLRVKGKADNSRIRLRWSQLQGADGYKIYQYDSGSGEYMELATVEGRKKTTYAIEGSYKSLKTYRFMVRAFARSADGKEVLGASATASYKTHPGKVKGLSAELLKSGKVKLSWKRVRRVDGYIVLRSRTGENSSFREIAEIKGSRKLSYTDSDVESGESYYYAIRAYTSGENGAYRQGAKGDAVSVEVQ